ncbi:MAG: ABC transporter ATP-binding protein [Lachnospiraceae bacterium]
MWRSSLKLLFGLYRGSYGYLFLSLLFYVIKHSPAWILPIITAKVVDIAASGNQAEYGMIVWYLLFMAVMTIQNLPTSHLHVHFRSLAIRQIEAELRGALVRKLQHLSILYHKQMSSGRLQSKIMRDVEAVENLSTQMFIQMVSILLSIGIALTVTLAHSRIVFIMFLVTIPLSAAAVFLFRKRMKETNQQFRQEVEHTSGHVMEMMELIPITRAHALEEEEIQKMTGYLEHVAENGYRLDVVQNLFGATGWVIFQVSQLVCLGFTSYLAIQGKVTIGDVVLYQSYYTTIITQLTNIMNLVPIMAKGFESLHSIGEVMTSYDEEDYTGKNPVGSYKRSSGIPACDLPVSRGQ